jgi:hypothetical protein
MPKTAQNGAKWQYSRILQLTGFWPRDIIHVIFLTQATAKALGELGLPAPFLLASFRRPRQK